MKVSLPSLDLRLFSNILFSFQYWSTSFSLATKLRSVDTFLYMTSSLYNVRTFFVKTKKLPAHTKGREHYISRVTTQFTAVSSGSASISGNISCVRINFISGSDAILASGTPQQSLGFTYNGVNRLAILAVRLGIPRSRGCAGRRIRFQADSRHFPEICISASDMLSGSYSRMIFQNRCCGLPPAVRSLKAFRSLTRSVHSILSPYIQKYLALNIKKHYTTMRAQLSTDLLFFFAVLFEYLPEKLQLRHQQHLAP